MKRIATLLFIAALLLTLNACFFTEVAPGTYHSGTSFILNGITQNTFTIHYGITEEYVYIPTNHFLAVIGATENHPSSYAGSTFFYSFTGKNFVGDHMEDFFMLEEDYTEFLNSGQLDTEKAISSMPDHISLMNFLKENGIPIVIDYDYDKQTISVLLPNCPWQIALFGSF